MGIGWNKSIIGNKISCIAVCEIIDDESVKCKVHGNVYTAWLYSRLLELYYKITDNFLTANS